jgi:TPR repeat protein
MKPLLMAGALLAALVSLPLQAQTAPQTPASGIGADTSTILQDASRLFREGRSFDAKLLLVPLAGRDVPDALFAVGRIEESEGMYARAAELYERAAKQKHGPSINNLGALYAEGLGVPRDPARAVASYREAAQLGSADGMVNLALALITRATTAQAGESPAELVERAANLNHPVGMRLHGSTLMLDAARQRLGFGWLEKAAAAGDAPAMVDVALAKQRGQITPRDFEGAARLLQTAAATGLPAAKRELATVYELGLGVATNTAEAQRLRREVEIAERGAASRSQTPAAQNAPANARPAQPSPGQPNLTR